MFGYRPVAEGGAGGGLEPPKNFWKLKNNKKKIIINQINGQQSVLNTDAASPFSQPLKSCLLPVSFLGQQFVFICNSNKGTPTL